MKSVLFLFFAATAASATINPKAEAAPAAPGDVSINSDWSGNGCPQGSVSNTLSGSRNTLTYGFDIDYQQVAIGPGISTVQKRKNCQIHTRLRYPSGYQVAVEYVTWSGYASLKTGANLSLSLATFFSRSSNQASASQSITGGGVWASGMQYNKQYVVFGSQLVWSDCGYESILNLNSQIGLSGDGLGDGTAYASKMDIGLVWKTC